MTIFCGKNYRYSACFSEVMSTYRRGPVFETQCIEVFKIVSPSRILARWVEKRMIAVLLRW